MFCFCCRSLGLRAWNSGEHAVVLGGISESHHNWCCYGGQAGRRSSHRLGRSLHSSAVWSEGCHWWRGQLHTLDTDRYGWISARRWSCKSWKSLKAASAVEMMDAVLKKTCAGWWQAGSWSCLFKECTPKWFSFTMASGGALYPRPRAAGRNTNQRSQSDAFCCLSATTNAS